MVQLYKFLKEHWGYMLGWLMITVVILVGASISDFKNGMPIPLIVVGILVGIYFYLFKKQYNKFKNDL